MYQIILITHVIIAVILIVLVLVTQTRGGGMSAISGGASQTVFGSQGSTSFLFRLTSGFAALFFATSLGLSFLVYKHQKPKNALGFTVSAEKAAAPQEKSQSAAVPVPTPAPNATEKNKDENMILKPKNGLEPKDQKPLIQKK